MIQICKEIGDLTGIQWLDLRDNPLTEISKELEDLFKRGVLQVDFIPKLRLYANLHAQKTLQGTAAAVTAYALHSCLLNSTDLSETWKNWTTLVIDLPT